jgi:hypothetical protein
MQSTSDALAGFAKQTSSKDRIKVCEHLKSFIRVSWQSLSKKDSDLLVIIISSIKLWLGFNCQKLHHESQKKHNPRAVDEEVSFSAFTSVPISWSSGI